jgi:hypothetical protein
MCILETNIYVRKRSRISLRMHIFAAFALLAFSYDAFGTSHVIAYETH